MSSAVCGFSPARKLEQENTSRVNILCFRVRQVVKLAVGF